MTARARPPQGRSACGPEDGDSGIAAGAGDGVTAQRGAGDGEDAGLLEDRGADGLFIGR